MECYSLSNNQPWDMKIYSTEVGISHEAKLSGICETEVWDKSTPYLIAGFWISILSYRKAISAKNRSKGT